MPRGLVSLQHSTKSPYMPQRSSIPCSTVLSDLKHQEVEFPCSTVQSILKCQKGRVSLSTEQSDLKHQQVSFLAAQYKVSLNAQRSSFHCSTVQSHLKRPGLSFFAAQYKVTLSAQRLNSLAVQPIVTLNAQEFDFPYSAVQNSFKSQKCQFSCSIVQECLKRPRGRVSLQHGSRPPSMSQRSGFTAAWYNITMNVPESLLLQHGSRPLFSMPQRSSFHAALYKITIMPKEVAFPCSLVQNTLHCMKSPFYANLQIYVNIRSNKWNCMHYPFAILFSQVCIRQEFTSACILTKIVCKCRVCICWEFTTQVNLLIYLAFISICCFEY